MFELLAVPHADLAAQHVDRGLVMLMLVRLRPCARRDRSGAAYGCPCADRLCGDGGSVGKTLLADERLARPKAAQAGLSMVALMDCVSVAAVCDKSRKGREKAQCEGRRTPRSLEETSTPAPYNPHFPPCGGHTVGDAPDGLNIAPGRKDSRRINSGPCATARPARWPSRTRIAPSPQATVMSASRIAPGAPLADVASARRILRAQGLAGKGEENMRPERERGRE